MNEPTQALTTTSTGSQTVVPSESVMPVSVAVNPASAVTPAQARIESVASALDAAYKNASTLKLSEQEAQALSEDFPDEAFRLGAGGDPNLIYIEHAYLRQRLNKVLGIGACVPIRRREWAEEFTYFKDGRNKTGVRVYVDLALLVRGCLVGEAIGDAIYYPDNAKTNYSDALESAKSNAFRRCAKEFGVGLQAWMKGWGEEWKSRQHGNAAAGPRNARTTSRPVQPVKTPEKPSAAPKPATSEDVLPKKATEATRKWMLDELLRIWDERDLADFALGTNLLRESDELIDWPLDKVPTSKQGLSLLSTEIGKWLGDKLPSGDTNQEFSEWFWDEIITVPRAKTKRADYMVQPDTIKSLYQAMKAGDENAKVRLWGLCREWEPKEWEGRDGKMHAPSKEDVKCREALDAFMQFEQQPDLIP